MKRLSVFWRLVLFLIAAAASFPANPVPVALAAESGPTLRAVKLNGTNSYLQVANASALNPADSITLEAWIYPTAVAGCHTIVGKDVVTSYWLVLCDGRLRFYPHGPGIAEPSNAVISASRWTHVAVTYDGSASRYYINGQLDRTSTAFTGPLRSNTSPLGIGIDPNNPGSPFAGMLDEVRLWAITRAQADIQSDMYTELWSSGGLVAAWRLNGNGWDALGPLHASPVGDVRYETNGVLPFGLTIPLSSSAVTVDGICGTTEYGLAERVGLRTQLLGQMAYIQHSGDDLYICLKDLALETGAIAAVAVDRNYSRDSSPQNGDYRFIVDTRGAVRAEQGTGSGWAPLTTTSGSWAAAAAPAIDFVWSAEFRLSRTILEQTAGWSLPSGIDIFELGTTGRPNHWPIGADANIPGTWSEARYSDGAGAQPTYQFSGQVKDNNGNALPNVTVQLLGTSLIATALTNSSGAYSFTYTGYSPATFTVMETDPRGAYSLSANAGPDGTAPSTNVLIYPGSSAAKNYSSGLFVDAFGISYGPSLNKHYLIIYSAPVREADLGALVDMKRLEGFQVETVSIQSIEATISGLDLLDKIRNWLKSRWEMHRPAPVYALLIGRGDVIPVPDYGRPSARDYDVTWDHPLYKPLLQSDWYFADLDSTWDIDRDRRLGECLVNVELDPNICESGDPLYAEGPYGTSPGTEDDWVPEISIGRLAINDPAEVSKALETSVSAEASGSPDKLNGVVAGSFWTDKRRSWNAETGTVDDTWKDVPPYGDDTAVHFEGTLLPILNRYLNNVTRLYNSTTPASNPGAPSRTSFLPDLPLTHSNMQRVWQGQRLGLVNVAGHSGEAGVAMAEGLWVDDWNGNGVVDQPAPNGNCSAPPCNELTYSDAFIIGMANDMGSPAGTAPVVFARGCSTGQVGWSDTGVDPDGDGPANNSWVRGHEAVAGSLSSRGFAAAWIGAQLTHVTHGTETAQDQFNNDILSGPLLLGDALWKANRDIVGGDPIPDWRVVNMQLFGDPAYSYWGNPLDMRAYWPQSGRDWFGASASPASGPSAGLRLWTATDGSPKSTPAVDRQGNIIVAGDSQLLVFAPNGALVDSAALVRPTSTVVRQPAITTDGVYLDADNTLYNFTTDLTVRDARSLPTFRSTAEPRVGPDGVVWWPTERGMMRATQGFSDVLTDVRPPSPPHSPVAFTSSGGVVWTNADGTVYFYQKDRYGNTTQRALFAGAGVPVTGPVVGPGDAIYVGRGNMVSGIPFAENPAWNFDTGSAVANAPAVGQSGAVYAGNQGGSVFAIARDGSLLWSRAIGSPVVTTPAVDNSRVYVTAGSRLYALDAFSGELLWNVDLGGPVDRRSSPVIGANRTIYVTTGDGKLVAVGQSLWLAAPSSLRVTVGIGQATLQWRDNSTGELGFQIEVCLPTAGCRLSGQVPSNVTTFTTQPPADEQFTFRIQAVAGQAATAQITAGTEGAQESSDYVYSDPATVLPPIPPAPANMTAEALSSDSVQIKWSFAGNTNRILGFDILRSNAAGGPFNSVGAVSASTTSFADKALDPGATYFYKVQTVSASGASQQAGPARVVTKPQLLDAPTQLRAIAQKGAIQLRWTDNASNETGYMIERQVPGGMFERLARLPSNSTGYTDAYLLAAGNFEYRVRAVSAGAESQPKTTSVTYGASNSSFLPIISR